jgi:hypothetical protein
MRHFLLVLVLLLSLVAAGADVRGRVTAADSGLPVAGANVIAAGTAVMTDLNGHFHLPDYSQPELGGRDVAAAILPDSRYR